MFISFVNKGRIFIVQILNSSGRRNLREGAKRRPDFNNLQLLLGASDKIFSVISHNVLLDLTFVHDDFNLHVLGVRSTSQVSGHGRSLIETITVSIGAFILGRLLHAEAGTSATLGDIPGLGNLIDILAFTPFRSDFSEGHFSKHVLRKFSDLVSVLTLAINTLFIGLPNGGETFLSSDRVSGGVNSATGSLDPNKRDEGLLEVEGPFRFFFGYLHFLDLTIDHGELNRVLKNSLELRGHFLGLGSLQESPVLQSVGHRSRQSLIEVVESNVLQLKSRLNC